MILTITPKDDYDREFVYSYLPTYMYNILRRSLDKNHLERLSKSFNFDIEDALLTGFKNLKVTEDVNSYTISLDKNLKKDNLFIAQLVKMITFGNLNTKGYPIANKIFDLVRDYLPSLFKEWKRGR